MSNIEVTNKDNIEAMGKAVCDIMEKANSSNIDGARCVEIVEEFCASCRINGISISGNTFENKDIKI